MNRPNTRVAATEQSLIAAIPLGRGVPGRRDRSWPIVLASVAFNIVLLTWLGVLTPKAGFQALPDEKPVTIQLIPQIRDLRTHTPRPAEAQASRTPAPSAALSPARPHLVPPPVLAPASPVQAPPGSPQAGESSTAAQAGTSTAPGPLPAAEGGRGVRALLRGTVGCDYDTIVHLTQEEKARCAQRFADGARKATPFMATPGEKLGGFMDEVAANQRKQRFRDGPMSAPVVACSGQGSNFGLGCLPDSAIMHSKP